MLSDLNGALPLSVKVPVGDHRTGDAMGMEQALKRTLLRYTGHHMAHSVKHVPIRTPFLDRFEKVVGLDFP
jgi:hypothetical protein